MPSCPLQPAQIFIADLSGAPFLRVSTAQWRGVTPPGQAQGPPDVGAFRCAGAAAAAAVCRCGLLAPAPAPVHRPTRQPTDRPTDRPSARPPHSVPSSLPQLAAAQQQQNRFLPGLDQRALPGRLQAAPGTRRAALWSPAAAAARCWAAQLAVPQHRRFLFDCLPCRCRISGTWHTRPRAPATPTLTRTWRRCWRRTGSPRASRRTMCRRVQGWLFEMEASDGWAAAQGLCWGCA